MEIKLKVQNVSNLLLLFLFLGVCTCFGQNKETQDIAPKFKGGSLFGSKSHFRLPPSKGRWGCHIVRLSFNVNADGTTDSVIVSGNLLPDKQHVYNYLIEYVKSTRGQWEPRKVNGVPTLSKKFIYDYFFYETFDENYEKNSVLIDHLIHRDYEMFHKKGTRFYTSSDYLETESSYIFPIQDYGTIR